MLKLLLYFCACICSILVLFYNPTPFNLVVLTAFLCCASAITSWKEFTNTQENRGVIKFQVICWTLSAVLSIFQLVIRILI